MPQTRVAAHRARNRKRIYAIAAAGTVLAAGVTIPSLAAWTDTEWIIGGIANNGAGDPGDPGDNGGGVSTSTFEVEQKAAGDAAFADYETEDVANVIDFSEAAGALSLGDTVYAYVDLRTKTDSLGGTLAITPATEAGELADELRYGARLVTDAAACTSAGFAASTDVLQASGSALSVSAGTSFSLAANAAETKTVCFELNLPATAPSTLQGKTAAPQWYFAATSVAP